MKIAIFVRSASELDRARAAAELAAIPFKALDDRVETIHGKASITTMQLAKGLEFRAVAVMACDDETIPLQQRIETVADDSDLEEVYNTERQLLYVACTRARDQLLVTSVAPPSEFLVRGHGAMIKRSQAQKIGSQGHKWAISQIENHPHWLARDLSSEDFGVDAEGELSVDAIKGEILKLQFKASEQVPRKDNLVRIDIERKYVEYAESCRYPVILVRIDVSAKLAWYLWLQKWILEERAKGNKLPSDQQSFTTWID
jgi:ATP-dependent exoDNAse (exonuclease V) beta subunit